MKFTIVTPCRNAESLIGDTVRTVVGQTALSSGRAELQYLICDGASTDGTLEKIGRFASPDVHVDSVADSGMYDALARGLKRAEGDWIGYLNAGDLLSDHAFDIIVDVAEQHDVQWVTGIATRHTERGAATYFSLPYRYRRPLMIAGQYTRRPPFYLPWIQQESTFWRASLLRHVDYDRLRGFRYAGDCYLWSCLAREADLHIVAAQLAGFRQHAGQLSEAKQRYIAEVKVFAPPPRLRDTAWAVMDNVLWHAPWSVKKLMNRRLMLQYDFGSGKWV
jgi:glycosyltransferase involved in cell wall biosynthesis